MRSYVSALTVAAALLTSPLDAQCYVNKQTNEAKLLSYYAAPLVFSPSGSLGGLSAGAIRLGFDVTLIPAPSDELRRTSKCFLPKDENSQLSPIFPRPRFALGLGSGFFVEGMYLPPVTVMDATPNLGSIALGFARNRSELVGFAIRGHATFGQVEGPISCNEDALQDTNPNGACFGDNVSKDTYKPNVLGVDAALTLTGGEKLRGYLGAGFYSLKPRFRVGFQPRNTGFDSTRVIVGNPTTRKEVGMKRISLLAGGAYHFHPNLAITAEVFSVPEDLTTLRFGGTWTLRR